MSDALEQVLGGATLLGLELDTRYRVLAATIEPAPDRHPVPDEEDRRLQVLAHPVSTVLGVLTRDTDQGPAIVTFEAEQLVDVASALAGTTLQAPVVGRREPQPGEWGPQWSLQGRSTAPDGRTTTVTYEAADEEARLRLFARCDHIELRDPTGEAVHPA